MMRRISFIRNSNVKSAVIRIVNVLLVAVLLVSVFVRTDTVLRPQESKDRFREFFEEDQEYDVLFFGSSHMLNSVNPMQLWHEYGITSYNWAGAATWTPASYWIFRNAIEYHKPRIAVLDVYGTGQSFEEQNHSMLHHTFDMFPLSATKVRAVYDLIPEQEDREELLFPFNIYHSRWSSLTPEAVEEALRQDRPSCYKGSTLRSDVSDEVKKRDFAYSSVFDPEHDESTDGMEYVVKFIETCYAEGIQPVLLYVPYNVPDEPDLVSGIAEAYQVPFFDYYICGNELVNYKTDLPDRAHVNFSGATKITKRLGQELSELFQPEHGKEQTEKWDKYYQNYREDLWDKVENAQSLQELFVYLADPTLRAEIYVAPEGKIPELDDFSDTLKEKCQVIRTDREHSVRVCVQDAESGNTVAEKVF